MFIILVMLSFQNVYKSYGSQEILKGLSFAVDEGEIFGLLAANGGGKTTAMRIAMGLIPMDSGQVYISGQEAKLGSVRGVGYMPEERGLYLDEKVGKQLRYLARLHKMSESNIDSRVETLLGELEIESYENQLLKTLSLGNKQKVQIAAALIAKPKLLILDEPFSGLDPMAVNFFSELLRSYVNEGASVLFSSHQTDVVERVSDRLGVMKSGELVFDGSADEFKKQESATMVRISLDFDDDRTLANIDFSRCPSVISTLVGEGFVELKLSQPKISMGELARSGVKLHEIVEVSYQKHSLMEALSHVLTYGEKEKEV